MRLFSAVFLLMMSGFALNCNPQKTASAGSSSTPSFSQETVKAENSMVYLFFSIERETNGNEVVKLVEKKSIPGTIKNASLENEDNIPGNIRVAFLGKDGQEISERFVENPLNPMMEVYTEEGINKERMNLQKAEFSVRFNQNGDTSAVMLEKISTASKKHLLTIKL